MEPVFNSMLHTSKYIVQVTNYATHHHKSHKLNFTDFLIALRKKAQLCSRQLETDSSQHKMTYLKYSG